MMLWVDIQLKKLLDEKGISEREFSRRTGIRQATINSLCNNEVKHLSLKNLRIICSELDIEEMDKLLRIYKD
ncbi:helix-turn-helix protein [compost metagenome]